MGQAGWPAFVRREFEACLRCGILEHGVLRVGYERCGDTTVVGFSCKGRRFCPSGGGRLMSELAAHLVDHVLPAVPIRQTPEGDAPYRVGRSLEPSAAAWSRA